MAHTDFGFHTTGLEVVKTFARGVQGKTVLITGPSQGGVGAMTAIDLAQGDPAHLIVAGRTLSKVEAVIQEIKKSNTTVKVDFVPLDLSSQASVREAAAKVSELTDKLDILINNAGIMAVKEYSTTPEGIELQLGTNHVGHFLLTNLLLPLILKATDAGDHGATRIVNVSSNGYTLGGVRSDYNFANGKEYHPWFAYAQSKTANLLFTLSLAEKLKAKGVASFAVSPGLVLESNLQKDVSQDMFQQGIETYKKVFEGRQMPAFEEPKELIKSDSTTLVAALDPTLTKDSGSFLMDCKVKPPGEMEPHGSDRVAAESLWSLSEHLVGKKFTW